MVSYAVSGNQARRSVLAFRQKDFHHRDREEDHRSRWIAARRAGDGWTFLAFDDPAIYPRRQCGKTKRYRTHLMIKPRRRTAAAPKSCNLARGDREPVRNRTVRP